MSKKLSIVIIAAIVIAVGAILVIKQNSKIQISMADKIAKIESELSNIKGLQYDNITTEGDKIVVSNIRTSKKKGLAIEKMVADVYEIEPFVSDLSFHNFKIANKKRFRGKVDIEYMSVNKLNIDEFKDYMTNFKNTIKQLLSHSQSLTYYDTFSFEGFSLKDLKIYSNFKVKPIVTLESINYEGKVVKGIPVSNTKGDIKNFIIQIDSNRYDIEDIKMLNCDFVQKSNKDKHSVKILMNFENFDLEYDLVMLIDLEKFLKQKNFTIMQYYDEMKIEDLVITYKDKGFMENLFKKVLQSSFSGNSYDDYDFDDYDFDYYYEYDEDDDYDDEFEEEEDEYSFEDLFNDDYLNYYNKDDNYKELNDMMDQYLLQLQHIKNKDVLMMEHIYFMGKPEKYTLSIKPKKYITLRELFTDFNKANISLQINDNKPIKIEVEE